MYNFNDTITNLPDLAQAVTSRSSYFTPFLLLFIWISISLSGYFAQEKKTSQPNILMWISIGGFFTSAISFLMLAANLIELEASITCAVLTILFILTYFTRSRE